MRSCLGIFLILGFGGLGPERGVAAPGPDATFTLGSPAFAPGGAIPRRHTPQGADRPPALQWRGAPATTRAFALIVHDPDAPDPASPKVDWVHWVIYDLPATTTALPEGYAPPARGPARPGRNDWGDPRWRGPDPPVGRHRYFFRLIALDAPLGDLHEPRRSQLERAMSGHVLGIAELVGTYQRRP